MNDDALPRNWSHSGRTDGYGRAARDRAQHAPLRVRVRWHSISQPPAPFHVTPRGWAGPNLLAMLLFEKFGHHQPLNRQADRYAREGVPLSLSTLIYTSGYASNAASCQAPTTWPRLWTTC